MKFLSTVPAYLVACALALSAMPAAAGPSPSSPAARKQARALFEKGKQLGRTNDWQGAHAALEQSFDLRPSHDTAADLAYAASRLGRFAEAARRASYALAHMPTGEAESKRNAVKKILDGAKQHVASVQLSADPPDADISVDGTSVGAASELEGPVFLDPGTHAIAARADGYKSQSRSVDAKEGATDAIALKLERAAPLAPPTSAAVPGSQLGASHPSSAGPSGDTGAKPPPPHASHPLWPALVGGGVAVAGLATGIGLSLAASSASSDHDAKLAALGGSNPCGAGTPNASACSEISRLGSTAARDRNIATAGFIVGGVSAVATVVYLLWPRSNTSARSSSTGVRVSAALRPDFGGLEVGGSF